VFTLDPARGREPIVLVSAGIGATPVLAMLDALRVTGSRRDVWWIHGARSGAEHAFDDEVRRHVAALPRARSHIRYSRPGPPAWMDDLAGALLR
jgi:ferredoxin-NADP reductase